MQERVVVVIRELMKLQGVSIRQISAKIAEEHGGSALGYTQQINRILNDPKYEPSFTTVEKVLSALKFSMWQLPSNLKTIEARLDHLSDEISEIKDTISQICLSIESLSSDRHKIR
ncbi:MAG: XRE family transcriptional regulator [Plectolyngbya sp. WJT66-NPBG17]|jgi:chromosome segregation ATPase|nr:XRE family transcriptional regulator [Plectolyngbya sp. WJT66-NPBG17]MBW4524779.1 XRE family transcriptional regulator [Phormidium tanganyikae FI6-MK23]